MYKMRKNDVIRMVSLVMMVSIIFMVLTSCAAIDSWVGRLKGELVGNDYDISQFDNFGTKVYTVHGDKVTMDCETDDTGEPTSYIDIAIDGASWKHVGGTLVFAQNGVDMITDFQLPEDMEVDGNSSGLMAVDRFINNYRNLIGKDMVVLVSSQNGTPIGLFQGDDCYMTVSVDLPKTTQLSIDGKAVYIHRANVDIFPAGMLN